MRYRRFGFAGRKSRRRGMAMFRFVATLEDIVLGRGCALCGDPLFRRRTRASQVCRACTAAMYRSSLAAAVSRCSVCGRPLLREQGTCTSCRKLEQTPPFDSHVAALEYRAGGEELVAAFKMRRNRAVVRLAASLLLQSTIDGGHTPARPVRFLSPDEPVCVPVPPGSRSARRRDFQPVDLLAREVARMRNLPSRRLLTRVGKRLDQKKLGREERSKNVAGKFVYQGKPPVPPVVFLIDDVYTTGATVSECARILKEAGVREVHVRTLAMD
ncbi:MAG: hypothetical protein ACLFM0_10620 [Spirochaetales bacterium]